MAGNARCIHSHFEIARYKSISERIICWIYQIVSAITGIRLGRETVGSDRLQTREVDVQMTRTAKIVFGSNSVELGIISNITDTIATSTLGTTIPMLKAEEQFDMDLGTTEGLSVSSAHISGDTLSNSEWVTRMASVVNRWQAETDGCRFVYNPSDDLAEHIDTYDTNCYVGSMTLKWSAGNPEVITSTISFKVGSIMGGKGSGGSPATDMDIYMSDSDGTWHNLCQSVSDGWNSAVQDMNVKGGYDQPFESVELRIPRIKLGDISSKFLQTDGIRIGRNMVRLNGAMGWGDYIVSAVKSDNTDYKISALSVSELFNRTGTTTAYGSKRTVKVQKVKWVQFGVSVPSIPMLRAVVMVKITYTGADGRTYMEFLNSHDNLSTVIDVYMGTDTSVKVEVEALILASSGVFAGWSDGNSQKNREIVLTEGFSIGSSWKINVPDSDPVTYSSEPPQVEKSPIEETVEIEEWEDLPIFSTMDIINDILGNEGVTFNGTKYTYSTSNSAHNGRLHLSNIQEDSWGQRDIYFPQNTNCWYVLQLCAYYLGAKIHFSDGDCYITGYPSSPSGTIDLSSNSDLSPFLLEVPELGSEKSDNIINKIPFRYGTKDTIVARMGTETEAVQYNEGSTENETSISSYGIRSTQRTLYGIRSTMEESEVVGKRIADGMMAFNLAGGQAITFILNENVNGDWVSKFGTEHYPQTIKDDLNKVSLSTSTALGQYAPILGLREYTRNYPKCTATYTFGPQNPVNLSMKIAQIERAIDNS